MKLDEPMKEKPSGLSDCNAAMASNIFEDLWDYVEARLLSKTTFFTSEYHNGIGLQRCYIYSSSFKRQHDQF